MACVPGTPCFENTVNAYVPQQCDNGWVINNFPIPTSYSQYDGPNLPNSGVNTNDCLTVAIEKLDDAIGTSGGTGTSGTSGVNTKDNLNVVLQKLDNKLSASEIAEAFIAAVVNDPTIAVAFCTLVNQCINIPTTTTTTTNP